jgi:hypothetical protein
MKKSVSKSIMNRIVAINEMLPTVLKSDEIPSTYAGGTWPYYVQLEAPIVVQNQFVYIKENKVFGYSYGFEKRYNVNDEWSLDQLKYDLRIIKIAFNSVVKTK